MLSFIRIAFSRFNITAIRHDPHRSQDADDRNDDQEFDEGEAFFIVKKNIQSKSIISIK